MEKCSALFLQEVWCSSDGSIWHVSDSEWDWWLMLDLFKHCVFVLSLSVYHALQVSQCPWSVNKRDISVAFLVGEELMCVCVCDTCLLCSDANQVQGCEFESRQRQCGLLLYVCVCSGFPVLRLHTQDYNKQQRLADIRERDSFLTGIQTEKASTMPQASTYSHSLTTHVHKSLHSTLFSDKKPLCAEIWIHPHLTRRRHLIMTAMRNFHTRYLSLGIISLSTFWYHSNCISCWNNSWLSTNTICSHNPRD